MEFKSYESKNTPEKLKPWNDYELLKEDYNINIFFWRRPPKWLISGDNAIEKSTESIQKLRDARTIRESKTNEV